MSRKSDDSFPPLYPLTQLVFSQDGLSSAFFLPPFIWCPFPIVALYPCTVSHFRYHIEFAYLRSSSLIKCDICFSRSDLELCPLPFLSPLSDVLPGWFFFFCFFFFFFFFAHSPISYDLAASCSVFSAPPLLAVVPFLALLPDFPVFPHMSLTSRFLTQTHPLNLCATFFSWTIFQLLERNPWGLLQSSQRHFSPILGKFFPLRVFFPLFD